MRHRFPFLYLTIILFFTQCTSREGNQKDRTGVIESDHFFSSRLRKDHFIQEFVGDDVLLGTTWLRIISSNGDTLFNSSTLVSNYFWKVDNHYLDEEAKIERFWQIFDHSIDEQKFVPISDIVITGLNYSKEDDVFHDIINDSSSIAYPLQQDYWISFSKKYKKTVVFRAMEKDVLKKYGIE